MDAPALLIQAGKERRGAEGNGREEVGEETSSGRKEGQLVEESLGIRIKERTAMKKIGSQTKGD